MTEATHSALEVPESERTVRYQAGSDAGNLVDILASYTDTITDRAANDTAAEFIREKIRSVVRDPFTITGPSSPSVLSNMMVSMEQHVDWITDRIAVLRERGIAAIDASPEAEDA